MNKTNIVAVNAVPSQTVRAFIFFPWSVASAFSPLFFSWYLILNLENKKLSPWVCCKRDAAAKPACTLKHVAARELCGSLRVATGLPQSVQFCFLRAIYGMEYDEYEYNIIKNYKEFLCPRGCDYMLFTTTDLFNRFHTSSSLEPMPLILFWTPCLTVWHRHAGTWGSTCQKSLWRFAQIMALRAGLGTGENLKPWPWLCANHHVNPLYSGCGTAVEVHNYNNIQDPFRSWSSVRHLRLSEDTVRCSSC